MAACYKYTNGTVIPIAKVASQKLSYSQKKGLVLKGKYEYGLMKSGKNL